LGGPCLAGGRTIRRENKKVRKEEGRQQPDIRRGYHTILARGASREGGFRRKLRGSY